MSDKEGEPSQRAGGRRGTSCVLPWSNGPFPVNKGEEIEWNGTARERPVTLCLGVNVSRSLDTGERRPERGVGKVGRGGEEYEESERVCVEGRGMQGC